MVYFLGQRLPIPWPVLSRLVQQLVDVETLSSSPVAAFAASSPTLTCAPGN